MADVIILTATYIISVVAWYQIGKFVGRKEAEDEQDDD